MNINLLRLTPALATTTTLLSHGLRTTITTPTRYNHRRHTATLIDWNIRRQHNSRHSVPTISGPPGNTDNTPQTYTQTESMPD
jgi:hypothetical protein